MNETPSSVYKFLSVERTAIVLVGLSEHAGTLSGARRLVEDLGAVIARVRLRGDEIHAVGTPFLRKQPPPHLRPRFTGPNARPCGRMGRHWLPHGRGG